MLCPAFSPVALRFAWQTTCTKCPESTTLDESGDSTNGGGDENDATARLREPSPVPSLKVASASDETRQRPRKRVRFAAAVTEPGRCARAASADDPRESSTSLRPLAFESSKRAEPEDASTENQGDHAPAPLELPALRGTPSSRVGTPPLPTSESDDSATVTADHHAALEPQTRTALADVDTLHERRERQRVSIMLHTRLLEHACSCSAGASCAIGAPCRHTKHLLRHCTRCETRVVGGCDICRRIWALLQIHARTCSHGGSCPVPRCAWIKQRQLPAAAASCDS